MSADLPPPGGRLDTDRPFQPIRIAGSEEDDGLPYYVNSPSMQFYRDQQACTQLGLTARAETNCVMDLAASLQDISNPAN